MATADEILATMAEEAAATDQTAEVCTIDRCTRAVTIPEALRIVGVETDKDVTRRHFKVLCSYRGTNLSTFRIRIHFMNANKEKDIYYVTDAAQDGEYLTFSWVISRNATKYKGKLKFIACMVCDGGTDEEREWNSTLGEFTVLEGLEVELTDGEEEQARDAITQLLAVIDARESEAVEAVRAAGAETIASIPKDYTALSEEIHSYNAYDISLLEGIDVRYHRVHEGIDFSWSDEDRKICHVEGTATSGAFANIIANTDGLPEQIKPGGHYYLHFITQDTNIVARVYEYAADGGLDYTEYSESSVVQIAPNTTGVIVRLYVRSGASVNSNVEIAFLNGIPNADVAPAISREVDKAYNTINGRFLSVSSYYVKDENGNDHLNFDAIKMPGYYVIDTTDIIDSDLPDGLSYQPSALIVERFSPKRNSEFLRQTIGSVVEAVDCWYYRICGVSGVWSGWQRIGNEVYLPAVVANFGDSITWGRDGAGSASTQTEYTVTNALKKRYGCKATNYGVGGMGYFSEGGGMTALTKLQSVDLTGYDVVTLAFGTNDNSAPLGDTTDTDGTTMIGAMYQCWAYIRSQNPSCTVVFIAPPNASTFGEKASGYWYGYKRGPLDDYTLSELVEKMRAFCSLYHIPFIDNLDSFDNECISALMPDGVHPSDEGYKRYSKYIASRIAAYI